MSELAWQKEIVELHGFFEEWLGGRMENDDRSFRRLERVLAEGFAIVSPDGAMMERGPLLEALRAAHGSRDGLKIWIEKPVLRRSTGTFLLATYQEWQEQGGRKRGRQSTVVFKSSKTAPNGLLWLHVHETWLPN